MMFRALVAGPAYERTEPAPLRDIDGALAVEAVDAPYCEPSEWLADSEGLQCEHPAIRLKATSLTQLHRSARGRAVACFDFVRALAFRWPLDDESLSAPDVLRRGCGDSFAKSTLLVALLRAAGIPARMRVAALPSKVFDGMLGTDEPTLQHAYVEVLVGTRWLGVDGHVMDGELALAARRRLHAEGRLLGHGLHAQGVPAWDGAHDAFNQFVKGDPSSAPTAYWGPFHDGPQALAQLRRWRGGRGAGVFARASRLLANRRIATLRSSLH